MTDDYLDELRIRDPFLYGFIKGIQGAATKQGGITTTKPSNTYDAKWCHADKPKSLPAAKPVTKD